jgi:hypothetical protein
MIMLKDSWSYIKKGLKWQELIWSENGILLI